ncbi:MAG: hypothetical protein VXZ82_21095, partial [Planctomycetota bacterium]|nr:hypothetical protein [Planctomycetota bacterium]
MSELHQQIEQWLDWAQMDQAEFRRRLVSNTQQSKSLTARVNAGGPLTPAEQKQIEQYGNDSIGLLFVSMLLQSKRMDRKKGELTEDLAYSDYDVKLALIKAFNMSYTEADKLEGDDLENAIDAVLKSRNKKDCEHPILT